MLSSPVVITCALTGSGAKRSDHPGLPVPPKEQGAAAAEALQAGASVIHLHVRVDDEKPTLRLGRFREAIQAIQEAAPGIIIEVSTGAFSDPFADRLQLTSLQPEMATLNIGSANFFDLTYINDPSDVRTLAQALNQAQIIPKIEAVEVGHLEAAFRLHKQGLLLSPLHFHFALGYPGPMSGRLSNLAYLADLTVDYFNPKTDTWSVSGFGACSLPLLCSRPHPGRACTSRVRGRYLLYAGSIGPQAQLVGQLHASPAIWDAPLRILGWQEKYWV